MRLTIRALAIIEVERRGMIRNQRARGATSIPEMVVVRTDDEQVIVLSLPIRTMGSKTGP